MISKIIIKNKLTNKSLTFYNYKESIAKFGEFAPSASESQTSGSFTLLGMSGVSTLPENEPLNTKNISNQGYIFNGNNYSQRRFAIQFFFPGEINASNNEGIYSTINTGVYQDQTVLLTSFVNESGEYTLNDCSFINAAFDGVSRHTLNFVSDQFNFEGFAKTIKLELGAVQSSNLNYPINYPINYLPNLIKNSLQIEVLGVSSVGFVSVFEGAMIKPKLTNPLNGDFFEVNATLEVGDVLTVSTKNETAMLLKSDGTTENLFTEVSGSFFKLSPGVNTLTFTAESSGVDAKCGVVFREVYLNVI